jgi:hypothetical protein
MLEMKVTILLLIGFIASVHSAFASPTNDELVHALKNDAGRYDEACRGGSGGSNSTWVSCGKRDYAFDILAMLGWCRGKVGEISAEHTWHECTYGSYGYEDSLKYKKH